MTGGAGNLLEDLLGIQENNLSLPDFGKIEIKTMRQDTSSLLTLFHKEPLPNASVPKMLLSLGWRHAKAGTSHPESEMSFRSTTYGHNYSARGFKLKIDNGRLLFDFDPKKVAVTKKDQTGAYPTYGDWLISLENRKPHYKDVLPVYYNLDEIERAFRKKLDHTLYAIVKTTKVDGVKYHVYKEFLVMSGLKFDKVLDAITSGDVVVDFDARTGHNHGTKFRIKKTLLPDIFEKFSRLSN